MIRTDQARARRYSRMSREDRLLSRAILRAGLQPKKTAVSTNGRLLAWKEWR